MPSLELTEDEMNIIRAWRVLQQGGFGSLEIVMHEGRVVRKRILQEIVPQTRSEQTVLAAKKLTTAEDVV